MVDLQPFKGLPNVCLCAPTDPHASGSCHCGSYETCAGQTGVLADQPLAVLWSSCTGYVPLSQAAATTPLIM